MMHTNDIIDRESDSYFERLLKAEKQGLPIYLTHRSLRNLKLMALVMTLASLITCGISEFMGSYPAEAYRPLQLVVNLLFSACSLGTFFILRSRRFSLLQLVYLGLGYQVLGTFFLSMWDHLQPYPLDYEPRLFLPTTLFWVLVFPVLFPTTKRLVFLAGSGSLLMSALAILVSVFVLKHEEPLFIHFHILFSMGIAFALSLFMFHQMHKIQLALAKQRRMGSYLLKEKLGEGGMGEVWVAEHAMLRRSAVIKLIHPKIMATSEEKRRNIKRFEREAQSIASLYSANTIQIYDFGHMEDGTFFYVMEHLQGIDLERLLRHYGAMSQERAVYLLKQICLSLEEAHLRGLIHRDIKPGNIFLCEYAMQHDVVKVLDFGIVKDFKEEVREQDSLTGNNSLDKLDSLSTRPGSLCGTPQYMAPEMILGDEVDRAYDIYSLGCLAYHMLKGQALFAGKSSLEVLSDHISTQPVPLSERGVLIDPGFESLILQCLEKDPKRRPASMAEIGKRLAALPLTNPWSEEKAKIWWMTQKLVLESKDPLSFEAATQLGTGMLVSKSESKST